MKGRRSIVSRRSQRTATGVGVGRNFFMFFRLKVSFEFGASPAAEFISRRLDYNVPAALFAYSRRRPRARK